MANDEIRGVRVILNWKDGFSVRHDVYAGLCEQLIEHIPMRLTQRAKLTEILRKRN